jgi:predicted transcriptional regulator
MVYKNKGGQPREKAMVAAFALVTKFGSKQVDVATVLGCSQSTVNSWVKEMSFRSQISSLERELDDATTYIDDLRNELALGYDGDDN